MNIDRDNDFTSGKPSPTVLIVDDAPENITILNDVLKPFCKRVAAKSGEDALRIARSDNQPDLILLDVVMPQMDGFEVCRQLKADKSTQNIPVIFITIKGSVEDEAKGFALGAVDYLSKPISPPIVLARVQTHLSLVAARTELEKQNAELLEINKLREEVEQISRHDIKNPLSVIIGYSQMLLDEELTDEQRADLQQVEEAGFCILEMLNRSLDLFKIERGTFEFTPAKVDLTKLLVNVIRGIKARPCFSEATIECDIAGNGLDQAAPLEIKGDELLCYSILSNLIKNALEASMEAPTVCVSVTRNKQYEISVHNTGTVPQKIHHRFFDKFVTFGKEGGTGLGTYSARLLTETQGGNIQLTSTEEQGTTITVSLPIWEEN
jgi:signal transduction histidine kinase